MGKTNTPLALHNATQHLRRHRRFRMYDNECLRIQHSTGKQHCDCAILVYLDCGDGAYYHLDCRRGLVSRWEDWEGFMGVGMFSCRGKDTAYIRGGGQFQQSLFERCKFFRAPLPVGRMY